MKRDFKVGQFIRVTENTYTNGNINIKNKIGIIKFIDYAGVGVEFFEDINGHDGTNHFKGKPKHCWFISFWEIEGFSEGIKLRKLMEKLK